MSEFVMGARLELTDNFTPILTAATRATNDFMQSVNGVSPVVSSMAAATSDFTDTLNQVGDAMEETQSQANGATSGIEAMRNAMQQFNAGLQTLQGLVKRHISFEELTPALLHEFIDKIMVHEAEKVDGKRTQRIEIYYSFIGAVELPQKPGKEKTA